MLHQFLRTSNILSFVGGIAASSTLWLYFSSRQLVRVQKQLATSKDDAPPMTSSKQQLVQLQRPRIVLFGDSLTQQGFSAEHHGWASQLADLYQRRCDVINRGFSGYNSRWNKLMLPQIFPASDPSPLLITIFLGANDAALEGAPQHVPVEEYEENLREMIIYLRQTYPGVSLCLITPPPVNEGKWEAFLKTQDRTLDRKDKATKRYVDKCLGLGEKMRVPTVNTYELMEGGSQTDCSVYLTDGLHLSQRGNDALFAQLEKCLSENFEHLYPPEDKLDMQAPYWADVNPESPQHLIENLRQFSSKLNK
mmetsp:Transcript_3733/g.5219  ORF Transcript_3733/g.5219 Transcript_3733/m.5219 type:complete len:308 (+) Transcript_3733:62-985(+)